MLFLLGQNFENCYLAVGWIDFWWGDKNLVGGGGGESTGGTFSRCEMGWANFCLVGGLPKRIIQEFNLGICSHVGSHVTFLFLIFLFIITETKIHSTFWEKIHSFSAISSRHNISFLLLLKIMGFATLLHCMTYWMKN